MIIANPIYENKITKRFSHPADTDDVRILTDILNHSGINPEETKLIEDEQGAWRTVNAMFEDDEKELLKVLDTKEKVLNEKDK